MPECRKCFESFPNGKEIDGIYRNLSKRRFCLSCSPFGLKNRKDLTKETKYCLICSREIKTKGKKYCSHKCQADSRYRNYIDRWQQGLEDGLKGETGVSGHIRRWMKETYDEKCSQCGWAEVNQFTNSIPIRLDHIDGNWQNCRPENFRFLCPNCDSLTATYGSLNTGKGRPYFVQKGSRRFSVTDKHDWLQPN